MINQKIREYAKSHNVYLWEVANYLKISEPTITRKFRVELSNKESSEIIKAIDSISKTKEVERK